ncbi:unnamed protein product [Durusdinium trenchii]|uniref:Uncharacterized protein n=1 Tax=Durusdinium trenchii TaxID=1381693 RepID=A0ABP0HQK3_9DINO
MADQSLLIETLQAVHQHTEGVLDLLMKACNKMSLSELSTECVHQSAALKDTKKLFQTLRDAAKSSAPDQADLKEKLKNLETRVLELDSGVETSPRKVDGQGIRKVMNRISDFEAQVAAQMQAHNQDIEKKLSFLNSRRTGDEPCEGASWSQELDAVKYDVGELKDLLGGAKSDTAHVKRIVLACERDMEDFTAAMDAVNIDLDEMRARVDSTHSIITSRQRVEATVTAEISTMRLDMGDMQEALKAHDAWMEDVSQSLQEVHERCEALNMEITQVNHGFQAKLDAKTDITSWNDMNDDVDASIRTVRDMASSLRFEVDSRRRRVDEELLRIRSEVSSLDEKINSKTTEISRDAGKASRQLEERLQARQEQCSALEATLLRHAETHQALEGQMVQQKEQLESRITGVDACMKKQGDELHKNTQDRLDLLEQQQTKVTKDTQKHLNAMDLRLAALQGATGECKRDIGKLRDEVNSLTVKSAAHDVDIARNSDELRKLERQRVEGDQRQKQEFDSIYDELDQKVSEKNFQRLEEPTSRLNLRPEEDPSSWATLPPSTAGRPHLGETSRLTEPWEERRTRPGGAEFSQMGGCDSSLAAKECNRACDTADCINELQANVKEQEMKKEHQLIRAARDGNLNQLKEQIANKADVNVRQPLKLITLDRYNQGMPIRNCGLTPLMYAASSGHLNIVKTLLTAKARVDDTDERGVSALHLAAASGDFETFAELVNAKASTNLITEEGETVLDWLPQEVLEDEPRLNQFKACIPSLNEEDYMCVPGEAKSRPHRRSRNA